LHTGATPSFLSLLKVYLASNPLARMYPKDEAYKQIADLTERLSEQLASYKKSDYNETLTRRDFIDPFFKALS
jgi:hypothetical protein